MLRWLHPEITIKLLQAQGLSYVTCSSEALSDNLFAEFMYMYPFAIVRHGEGALMHRLWDIDIPPIDYAGASYSRRRRWNRCKRRLGKELANDLLSMRMHKVMCLVQQEVVRRREEEDLKKLYDEVRRLESRFCPEKEE